MTDQNFYYTIDPKTQAITPIQLAVTLRDQFAMAALGGINTKDFNPNEIAKKAYELADAMMGARK